MRILKKIFPGNAKAFEPAERNIHCHEFEVDKWEISRFVVEKLIPVVGMHPFPLDELMLMASTVVLVKPSHIFEWGTNVGKSARIFYETCRAFGIASTIHSIDLPDDVEHVEHPRNMRGHLVKNIREVHLHLGDGLDTALMLYRNNSEVIRRPVFFVDGDHGYESVRRELAGILANVKDASILVHDTFYQSAESKYNIGPYQAIMETVESLPERYRVISTSCGLPGMTFLWKR